MAKLPWRTAADIMDCQAFQNKLSMVPSNWNRVSLHVAIRTCSSNHSNLLDI